MFEQVYAHGSAATSIVTYGLKGTAIRGVYKQHNYSYAYAGNDKGNSVEENKGYLLKTLDALVKGPRASTGKLP